MKFLHCSDIHLGRKPVGAAGDYSTKRFNDYFEAFDFAVDTAIDRKADQLIIAGDLFDKKELIPEVLEKSELIFQKLKSAGVGAIVIEGNHDNITTGRESESWIVYLENKGLLNRPYVSFEDGNYKFYPVTKGKVNFWGLGYQGAFTGEVINALAEQLSGTEPDYNVVLVHTAPACPEVMSGTVEYDAIQKLDGKAMYVAGGHFHAFSAYPKEKPYFFIPGSLESWDLNEHSQKKGMILFDTDTHSYEFIPTQRRNIIYTEYTHNAANEEELLAGYSEFVGGLGIVENESLVVCKVKNNHQFYIDTNKLEELLKASGALKATVSLTQDEMYNGQNIAHSLSSVEQIEREVISSWEHFSANVDLTAETLGKLKRYFEEGDYKLVNEIFDAYLNSVIGTGVSNDN